MTELKDRLKKARKDAKLTQAQVASSIKGLSQPAYSDLESGKSKTTTKMAELANLFDVSGYWLATGKESAWDRFEAREEAIGIQRCKEALTVRKVPIIGRANMDEQGVWTENTPHITYGDATIFAQGVSDKAYALEAAGTELHPAIRAGWILLFDPIAKPINSEFVHIVLKDGSQMVKELSSNINSLVGLLSVKTDSRSSHNIEEIESINACKSIHPPSAAFHGVY